MLLGDMDITYDDVGNPIELRDWRDPAEWPAGSKPVTRKIEYDDLNRVSNLTYEYAPGDEAAADDEASDTWVSPFNRENTDPTGDARRSMPAPHISFPKRVQSQSYKYDWLGNIVETDDDAHGFYDRSLGTATHDSSRPYRLQSANNSTQSPPNGSGQASVKYDVAGNVTYVTVLRTGTCLPTTVGNCNQQYRYEWDEVGHLVRARRWDGVTAANLDTPVNPATNPAVDLRYRYDASDQRVLKRSYVSANNSRTTVSIFDSLELRRSNYTGWPTQDYALTSGSGGTLVVHEVAYLVSNGVRLARLGHETAGEVPEVSGEQDQGETNTLATLHVLLELGDHLGSTNLVVDKATGELVEAATYLPTGSRESDYRPDRWDGFREEYGFTGKEEDVEVGLIYFGKRYLNPGLGRWVSPDPLAIHVPGEADWNLYAYVSGALLKSVDPVGLDENDVSVLSPDAKPNAYGNANQQGAQWGMQFGSADPDNRTNIPVRATSDPAAFLDAYREAASQSEGGKIVFNVGHGGAEETGQGGFLLDLAPPTNGGEGGPSLRITGADLYSPDSANARGTGGAADTQRAHYELLREMGKINAQYDIREVVFLACNAGSDPGATGKLSNLMMTSVRIPTEKTVPVAHSTDNGPRVAMVVAPSGEQGRQRVQQGMAPNGSHRNDTELPSGSKPTSFATGRPNDSVKTQAAFIRDAFLREKHMNKR